MQTEGLQIGDHRFERIIYAVVERPDHHCGDDIVSKRKQQISRYWLLLLFERLFSNIRQLLHIKLALE